MKRTLILSVMILMAMEVAFAQEGAGLTVNVSRVEKLQGFVMIAVYDSANKFLSKELVVGAKVKVDSAVISHRFEALPFGKYAISVYHDVDSDGELATNFIGIPKEPYGFSNGGVNVLGVPSFDRAVFTFVDPDQEINIDLK